MSTLQYPALHFAMLLFLSIPNLLQPLIPFNSKIFLYLIQLTPGLVEQLEMLSEFLLFPECHQSHPAPFLCSSVNEVGW
jgi:hypothetical protein